MNSKVKRYILNHKNDPVGPFYNMIGAYYKSLPCPTNPSKSSDCKVVIKLQLKNGIFRRARAEVFGESELMASAYYVVVALRGTYYSSKEETLASLSSDRIALELDVSKSSVMFSRCEAVHESLALALNVPL